MRVIPAIDLIEGACVRLYQGDYEQKSVYDIDAVELALNYEKKGASCLHVVDLDGAKQKQVVQLPLIHQMIATMTLPVQVGGGVRTLEDVQACLDAGASQVVIGSLAVINSKQCQTLLQAHRAENFVLALDVTVENDMPYVVSHAWTQNSGMTLWAVVSAYYELGIRDILCTDIACDGTMAGPNFNLYEQALKYFPDIRWQASGGVRHRQDLIDLGRTGVNGAIVGKALYQPDIDIADLLQEVVC